MKLFLIGTEFLNAGGIQRVNCMLIRAFGEFSAHLACDLHVFSYLDRAPELPEQLQSKALHWHPAHRRRTELAITLLREVRRHQPHLLVMTHVSLLPLVPTLRAFSPRTKIAVLGHGIEVWRPLPLLHRVLLRHLDSVVAPSRFTAERMAAVNGLSAEGVQVIPHSLPPDWRVIARRPRADGVLRLLTVSRLDPADIFKGIELLLGCMRDIRTGVPNVELVVAGDGADRARLENLARSLGLGSSVQFAGRVSDAELRALYSLSDLFVLPSTKEGFGLVYLEAMAAGLPVITARAGGAGEVVTDGETGVLVPAEDPEALTRTVVNLLGDATERERLARNAAARVQSNFLFAHFARRWWQWIAGVCPQAIYAAAHRPLMAEESPVEKTDQRYRLAS